MRTTAPPPTAPEVATVTVASVPGSHVYVRHIAAEDGDGVVRLPDPDPQDPDRSTQQQWWPPVMLSPAWVREHDFDVFHIQFGFDSWDPADLAEIADEVRSTGRRLVQTVHDLRNPHHRSRELHDAQLAVLLSRADEVITLTHGAAAEIQARWGRVAHVLPHPHVVDLDTMRRRAAQPRGSEPFRVGLHVKSLRASMDPLAILPTLVRTVREIPGAVLQVNGHRDVLARGGSKYDDTLVSWLRAAEEDGLLELHVHDFLTDEQLWDYLGALDASVLPYRFGTHSGWLEACHDLGTAVIAPSCGYYAEQGPVHGYVLDEERFDAASLARAVHDAYDAGPIPALTVEHRRGQRAEIASAHRDLYAVRR